MPSYYGYVTLSHKCQVRFLVSTDNLLLSILITNCSSKWPMRVHSALFFISCGHSVNRYHDRCKRAIIIDLCQWQFGMRGLDPWQYDNKENWKRILFKNNLIMAYFYNKGRTIITYSLSLSVK